MALWWPRRRAAAAPDLDPGPGLADARAALGTGDLAAAATALAPLLELARPHAEALHLAGIIACHRSAFGDAATLLQAAVDAEPSRLDTWRTLAEVHLETGAAAAAVDALRAALAADPGCRAAQERLVFALRAAGRGDEALDTYILHRAVGWHFDPVTNPAAVPHAQGLAAVAADCLRAAIAAHPREAELWRLLGLTRQAQGHLDTAISCFREALGCDPAHVAVHRALAFALDTAGETAAALEHYRAAAQAQPEDPQVWSDYLAARLYTGWDSRAEAAQACGEYERRVGSADGAAAPAAPRPRRTGRLRLGYVSGDLCAHAIAHFLEPVLERHDRRRVHVVCYDRTPQRDAWSLRLQGLADDWRPVRELGWDALADEVRADRIDVLVDLKGHFEDNHLPLFARRPAPAQATWLGYPDTTGLSAVDAWLTDDVIAADLSDQHAAEHLVSLGAFFMCFRPVSLDVPVSPLPARSRGHVTFGCFNTWSKVSPAMRIALADILKEVPGSRLLVTAMPGGNARQRFRDLLQARGVDPGRVELRGRGSHEDFLRWHHEVDLSLDSFPYNGTTTALHSLWMGVPFVTLAGRTHVSRVGASVLASARLQDWVSATADDYVATAVARARDLDALADLRASLRERLAASPAMDERDFTRRLENVLERLRDEDG